MRRSLSACGRSLARNHCMDIGFIGLGKMGSAMVRSLLRAGHQVTVYNRTASKAAPLRELGAVVAHAPAEACRGDAVFTMVSDDAAVRDIVCRPHGLLDVLEPVKTVHVSASTISPALVHELAERHRERNLAFVSVPVLGRPDVAEAGKLTALAAGDAALIDSVRPALEAFAHKTFVVGSEPEAANVVKLACNAMVATIIEALGEALALVMKTGLVEPKMFLDVLLGTVLASPAFRPYGEHLRDQQFEPGFRLPLALKDIELALGTAHEFAVPLPVISVIRDHMIEAIATGHGDQDWVALALVAQRAAGLTETPATRQKS
jgi:3-hydroxyisobutyrate dehydrogenase-like beta-hydroxyacid dehydrogenase